MSAIERGGGTKLAGKALPRLITSSSALTSSMEIATLARALALFIAAIVQARTDGEGFLRGT